jgi:hypothetical protein
MWLEIPVLRAFWQRASEVAVREPGHRFLGSPRPITSYATEHWEFAWLSVAAYQKTSAGQNHARQLQEVTATTAASPGPDPERALAEAGWMQWDNFPDDGLQKKFKDTHLRVEVWERKTPPAVAVTFGGTVFNNDADWRANLRWFTPGKRDEYTDVVQIFAPAFSNELRRRAQALPAARWTQLEIVSTGHSLGGGLAQQFAYSLPLDSVKRVTQVYAFDPSPVTGFYSVEKRLRDENKKGLIIDRIYERGEILAIVRSLTSLVHRPSAKNATIRGVRYKLFRAWNSIAAHSIVDLAAKLDSSLRST